VSTLGSAASHKDVLENDVGRGRGQWRLTARLDRGGAASSPR